MIIEGIVNPPSNIAFSDGDDVRLVLGKTGEFTNANLHQSLYTVTYREMLFHGYSTTPLAIPITSTTSPKFVLWNPYGSGVNCVLVKYNIGYGAGKTVEGNIQLGVILGAGARVVTGGPITAFTDGPQMNGLLGTRTSKARFGIAATIVAATRFLPLGISPMQLDAASGSPAVMVHTFDGTVIVPPGVAVFTCASAATSATFNEKLVWYEFPI